MIALLNINLKIASMKSKGIIFVSPEQAQLSEVELPQSSPRDIVVQTEISGVSVGTERWAYLGKRSEIAFPNVPGYQSVGVVTEAGSTAQERGWNVGDRVFYFSSRFAGELEGKSWMGSHVAQAVIDVCGPRGNGEMEIHHCEKVPADLAPEDAALSGLCAVAMRGIEMATIPAGAQVLVCGLGVIGQYAAQVCRLKGAEVTVSDIVSSRLEIAQNLGIGHIIDGNDDLEKEAQKIAPDGFDIIIDTSSVIAVVNRLFPLLKLRGKFVFQGWYPPPSALDLNAMHMRLPTCYFPCAHSAESVAVALKWLAQGWLQTKPLVTHTFPPERADEMYKMIAAGSENFLGLLIDWRENA